MKTIRQIADEIGVSKQTVYKRYKGKLHTVCAPYAHTEQGVLYIEEQGETLIKQDFLQKECSVGAHTYAHTERSNGEVLEQANTIELQKAQITSLERQLRPSIQKRLKEAQELSDLKDENMALEYELNRQKDLMARLMQRVEAALTFLEEKLPEQFRPYVQRARAHIMPEPKQEHRHDRGMSMGGMSR